MPNPNEINGKYKFLASLGETWHKTGRPYRFETFVKRSLVEIGAEILDRGWPDILCKWPDGVISGIEVKQGGDVYSEYQKRVKEILCSKGIPVWFIRDKTNKNPVRDFIDNFENFEMFVDVHDNSDFEGLGVS